MTNELRAVDIHIVDDDADVRDGNITPEELHTVVQRMAQLAERAGGVI